MGTDVCSVSTWESTVHEDWGSRLAQKGHRAFTALGCQRPGQAWLPSHNPNRGPEEAGASPALGQSQPASPCMGRLASLAWQQLRGSRRKGSSKHTDENNSAPPISEGDPLPPLRKCVALAQAENLSGDSRAGAQLPGHHSCKGGDGGPAAAPAEGGGDEGPPGSPASPPGPSSCCLASPQSGEGLQEGSQQLVLPSRPWASPLEGPDAFLDPASGTLLPGSARSTSPCWKGGREGESRRRGFGREAGLPLARLGVAPGHGGSSQARPRRATARPEGACPTSQGCFADSERALREAAHRVGDPRRSEPAPALTPPPGRPPPSPAPRAVPF